MCENVLLLHYRSARFFTRVHNFTTRYCYNVHIALIVQILVTLFYSHYIFNSFCMLSFTHLKINISNPFNNTVTGPDHRIQVSVFTLSSTGLNRLQRCYDNNTVISTKRYAVWMYRKTFLTSLSKLSICRSWMPDRMLVTWNLLVMLKMVSRSFRVREFNTLPSTSWLWKTCEYCGSPMSFSQHLDTQWWSISAALESLK